MKCAVSGEKASGIADLPIVRKLLASQNPSVVYKVRVNVLGESEGSAPIRNLKKQIKSSDFVQRLLSHKRADGTIVTAPHRNQTNPYAKWQGPHWTLACLAEIGYPNGDASLFPMRDQFYDWLLSERHMKMPATLIIPGQENKVRRCASQEGNAVWYSLMLGLEDERTEVLVNRLKQWQWPDGGWNCDKRPEAQVSSFVESIIPLRALVLHGRLKGDQESLITARRAAEMLLKRRLYKRQRDGQVINPKFTLIQYPYYAHYNILFALKVMAEADFVMDERCQDALDLLESKRLPDGGFPLEKKNYKPADDIVSEGSFVDWGSASKKLSNEFVTADALYVLKEAGRLTS